MAYEACIAEIEKATGRELTGEEKDAVKDRVKGLLGRLKRAERAGGDVAAEAKRLIAEDAAMLKTQALIAKRQKVINNRIKQVTFDYLSNVWEDNPAEGLRALMAGSLADRIGARDSVASAVDTLSGAKQAALLNDLEAGDLVDLARSGTLDLEIRQAAYALDTNDAVALRKLPEDAVAIARIFSKHIEVLRGEQNAAGAWIGKVPGYLHRQSYDMYKMAKAGGKGAVNAAEHFEAWKNAMVSRIDWDKSLVDVPIEDRIDVLRSIFNERSNGYDLQWKDATPAGTGLGYANLAKRQSHERKIVFKNAQAEQEIFEAFGRGENIYDAVNNQLRIGGRNLAIMRKLGPNAQANLAAVVNKLEKKYHKANNPKAVTALKKEYDKQMKKTWFVLSGESDISDSHALASVSEGFLNLQRITDLGMMTLSSMNDLNNLAAQMTFYGDRTSAQFFKESAATATNLALSLGRGTSRSERALMAESGMMVQSLSMPVSHLAGDNPLPGLLAKGTQFAMKYNGAQWMQNRLRTISMVGTGVRYASHRDLAADALPEGMQAALRQYNISADDWNVIRQAPLKTYGDHTILNSGSVMDLPDSAFGKGLSEAAARRKRVELADKFRNLAVDIAHGALTTPSSTDKAIATIGLKRGTWEGELLRHALLFKSYTMTYMRRTLGRELHSYHPDRIGSAAALWRAVSKPGQGSLAGLTGVIAGGVFWGHVSNVMIDTAMGKQPTPVPTDLESTKQVLYDAFKRSGAIGLYGDVLFNQINDYTSGAEFAANLLGPSFRRAFTGADIALEIARGDPEGAAEKAVKLLYQTTPGRSWLFTRGLTDYMVMQGITEYLNPGYASRLEQLNEEAGRPFIVPPSGL